MRPSQTTAIIFLVLRKKIVFLFVRIEFETVTNPALKTDEEDRPTADEAHYGGKQIIFLGITRAVATS